MSTLLDQRPAPVAEKVAARRPRPWLLWVAQHSLAIVLSIMFVAPVVFLLLTSLMSDSQALTANYWPRTWHLDNYARVFADTPMPRYLLNTVLYAVGATVFMLLSSVPAAYALAKLRWPGRNLVFVVIICMMMMPPR